MLTLNWEISHPDRETHKRMKDIEIIEIGTGDCVAAAGAILADLGAKVIKLVPPDHAPDALQLRLHDHKKQRVTVEPQNTATLLEHTDVLLTDLTDVALTALQLSKTQLAQSHPSIIHAQLDRPDEAGGQADENAEFFTRAGATGLMMSERPFAFAAGQGARSAAFSLTCAILAAVRQRDLTGRAHAVETSLLAAGLFSIANDITVAQGSGSQPSAFHRTQPLNPLGNSYRCSDGHWLLLGAASAAGQSTWDKFCTIVDAEAWMQDPRFLSAESRRENITAVVEILDQVFARFTRDE